MIQKTSKVFLMLAILLSFASCNFTSKSETGTTSTPKTDEIPIKENSVSWDKAIAKEFLTISALNKKNPVEGIFETEGYVVDSYKCECPIGYDCDCNAPSITISEGNENWDKRELSQTKLLIFTDPEGLQRDQKYRFKIKIPERDSDTEAIYYVDLVAYRVMK